MVQRRVLQCRLCWKKEKCLKPDLKCVNRWSSSTAQRKRVPESWSSNRETTSGSVQVVWRNWQKLLCGRPQRTRLTIWADQISKVAWLLKRGHQITKFGEFEINPLPDWKWSSWCWVIGVADDASQIVLHTRSLSTLRLEQLTNSELQ